MKNQRGFTLLELAISLLIIGVLGASALSAYKIHTIKQKHEITEDRLARLNDEIKQFRMNRKRYPCPASYTAGRSSNQYGVETRCDLSLGMVVGDCANGVCIEESTRDATIEVRRGTIPFRAMNLPESATYDGYGRRFSYAVTEELAIAGGVDDSRGGIDIVDNQNPSVSYLDTPGTATFLIFSHGENGVGGYTPGGVMFSPCNGVAAPDTGDVENCNTGDDDVATYRLMPKARVEGDSTGDGRGDYYDDSFAYGRFDMAPLWERSTDLASTPDSIHTTNSTSVGFSTVDPNTQVNDDVSAYVEGNIRVSPGDANSDGDVIDDEDQGALLTSEVCELDGSACFDTEKLAGDTPEMQCPKVGDPTKIYVQGIALGEVICTDQANVACPSGTTLQGINSDGSPNCTDSPCAEEDKAICRTTRTLAAAHHGESYLITAPDYKSQTWTCSAGNWRLTSDTGECNCVVTHNDRSRRCWDEPGYGPGYVGNIYSRQDFQCPSGTWGAYYDTSNTCDCRVLTEDRNFTCQNHPVRNYPDTYTGEIIEERSTVCPAGGYSAWAITSDTCVCNPGIQSRTYNCHGRYNSAYTGSIVQQRNVTCPAGTWTPWTDVSDTCVCTGLSQARTRTCMQEGYSSLHEGVVMQDRVYNCGTTSWDAWNTISDTCSCNAARTHDRTLSCSTKHPSYYTGIITERRQAQCGTGTWSAWAEISDTCACVENTQTRTRSNCPAPQIGVVNQERTRVCPGGAYTPWTDVSDTCVNPPTPTYSWKALGGSYWDSERRGRRVGASCVVAQVGKYSLCWAGSYDISTCVCSLD